MGEDVSGSTEEVGNVSAAIYYYPARASGFFLKGGAGFASYILHKRRYVGDGERRRSGHHLPLISLDRRAVD